VETQLTAGQYNVSDDDFRLAINIAIIALFGVLAHWKIKDFIRASAIGAVAAALYFQIIMIATGHGFAFGSIIGLVMTAVQSFMITAIVGIPFEIRRRRKAG
jgi:hypothetical protein